METLKVVGFNFHEFLKFYMFILHGRYFVYPHTYKRKCDFITLNIYIYSTNQNSFFLNNVHVTPAKAYFVDLKQLKLKSTVLVR